MKQQANSDANAPSHPSKTITIEEILNKYLPLYPEDEDYPKLVHELNQKVTEARIDEAILARTVWVNASEPFDFQVAIGKRINHLEELSNISKGGGE